MVTKRIFDTIIITGLALHLAWGGLVRPWGRRWATQEDHPLKRLVGETAVRAA